MRSFGITHFAVNSPFTLVPRNLREDAGNEAETVEEDFLPYTFRPGFYALRTGLTVKDSEGFYRLVLKLRKWGK